MSYVVAGVVLLLSLLTSAFSYIAIPYIKKMNIDSDEEAVKKNMIPVTAVSEFFKKTNWKRWLDVGVVSFICALAIKLLYGSGMEILDLVKYIVVLLGLLSAMIIDMHTYKIPNIIVGIVLIIGIMLLIPEFILYRENFVITLIMSVVGLLVCFVLFYVLARITKNGMGMGDVKLISALGWMLGLTNTLVTLVLALIICTFVAIFLICFKKKKKQDSVPFGPFIFWGYMLMLLIFSI